MECLSNHVEIQQCDVTQGYSHGTEGLMREGDPTKIYSTELVSLSNFTWHRGMEICALALFFVWCPDELANVDVEASTARGLEVAV